MSFLKQLRKVMCVRGLENPKVTELPIERFVDVFDQKVYVHRLLKRGGEIHVIACLPLRGRLMEMYGEDDCRFMVVKEDILHEHWIVVNGMKYKPRKRQYRQLKTLGDLSFEKHPEVVEQVPWRTVEKYRLIYPVDIDLEDIKELSFYLEGYKSAYGSGAVFEHAPLDEELNYRVEYDGGAYIQLLRLSTQLMRTPRPEVVYGDRMQTETHEDSPIPYDQDYKIILAEIDVPQEVTLVEIHDKRTHSDQSAYSVGLIGGRLPEQLPGGRKVIQQGIGVATPDEKTISIRLAGIYHEYEKEITVQIPIY